MDRRTLLMSLIGGGIAAMVVGPNAASAAPAAPNTTGLDGVRAALTGDTVEMQRGGRGGGRGGGGGFRGGGGGFRGGGGGFRGGGGGFRGGGGGFRGGGGGFRGGFRGGFGGPRFRRGWGGPAWGPGFGPRRRCWVNQWGELVCRRRRIYW